MERREYQMTQQQLDKILDKIKSAQDTPLIMLQCGPRPSVQQIANDAWGDLGKEMGFDGATARPAPGKGMHFFTAVPAGGCDGI